MIHAVSCSFPARPRSGPLYVRCRGTAPPALPSAAAAVVGSRRSSHGAAVAFPALARSRGLASQAARSGFAVVSGLALGCDTAAHRGCLEANGITVAVLPCGLDRVAPVSNTNLAHRILDVSGFLAGEYPPGVPPRNFRFVERNRVIVALSRAVIVTEAQLKGGTMHTAHFALEQNKPLACYLPEGEAPSPGCLHLVQEHNATPLRNPNDLKSFLNTLSCESAAL